MDPSSYDHDILDLAPVMPAIDAVKQLMEEESRLQQKAASRRKQQLQYQEQQQEQENQAHQKQEERQQQEEQQQRQQEEYQPHQQSRLHQEQHQQEYQPHQEHHQEYHSHQQHLPHKEQHQQQPTPLHQENQPHNQQQQHEQPQQQVITKEICTTNQGSNLSNNHDGDDEEDEEDTGGFSQPRYHLPDRTIGRRAADYEIVPKSAILNVYNNDPEVERFLQQSAKIGIEHGYNEQEYKCFSCCRPIGMVFGVSRLCKYDGHLYCTECHLDEKSVIPARILCNWDFKKYPVSKRNQHFLDLISTEPMFDLKVLAPLLYSVCVEMREMLNLRSQSFFLRSYCFTCTQDSISFELTKLVWPREHLIEHIHLYSLEDLEQVKSGQLAQLLKSVVAFGRRHVLNCMLCCQKGFICEICKSPQIIYPFDTDSVHRCPTCQTVFHLECFSTLPGPGCCPRCARLQDRTKGQRES